MYKITNANIKDWAKNYDGPLFDGILCDPPYHLVSIAKRFGGENSRNTPAMNTKEGGVFARKTAGFMGKDWDGVDENGIGIAQDPEMWRLLYNLLKPGGHLLAFSGSRTYHRMAVAIEDAGFEIRDQLIWMYGSGFPKSLNIGKAVDKIQGNEREITGTISSQDITSGGLVHKEYSRVDVEVTKGTSEWEGYGTALKPAHEPCVLARKPLDKGMTVAGNVLKHGTGGLNIDGTRVGLNGEKQPTGSGDRTSWREKEDRADRQEWYASKTSLQGRFPANLIHDGSDEVEAVFPQTKSTPRTATSGGTGGVGVSTSFQLGSEVGGFNDSGSASRYFYTAKASKSERNAGLEGFEEKPNLRVNAPRENEESKHSNLMSNHHPTVKPLSLTKYLATLIKPPTGGRLLVPFSGSGSEMIGALQAGWEYVEGVELTEEYIPIAEARIKYWLDQITEEDKQPKQVSQVKEPMTV